MEESKIGKGSYLQKKTHEKQFEFNSFVRDKPDFAEAALQKAPAGTAVDKAKALIAEYIATLKFRQKLNRIADRSEYDWAAVEQYVDDELGDGGGGGV